jgi:hypothetical protein
MWRIKLRDNNEIQKDADCIIMKMKSFFIFYFFISNVVYNYTTYNYFFLVISFS